MFLQKRKLFILLILLKILFLFIFYKWIDPEWSLGSQQEKGFWSALDARQASVLFELFNESLTFKAQKTLNELHFDLSHRYFKPLNETALQLSTREFEGDEIFVYLAYLETRDPTGTRIRILLNGNCETTRIEDFIVYLGNGNVLPIESMNVLIWDKCSHKQQYTNCRLREMEFTTIPYTGPFPDEIILARKSFHTRLKLYKLPDKYVDDVNSCIIVPLYWYNDWLRLFLSFESWKKNKVRRILINVHSISRSVKTILDYYIKEGLVEIRPWPWMPSSKGFNPNEHVFDVSHHLSMASCPVWSNTRFTTMNDVDELFIVKDRSHSLFMEVQRLMHENGDTNTGALELEHNAFGFIGANFSTIWQKNGAERLGFMKSARPYYFDRLPKYIYETKSVKTPWIHWILEFYGGKKIKRLNNKGIVYLHMRDTYVDASKESNIMPDLIIFGEQDIERMNSKLDEIFRGGKPPYLTPKTSKILEACAKKTMTATPGDSCQIMSGSTCIESMKDLDDWLFAVTTEHSQYVVV